MKPNREIALHTANSNDRVSLRGVRIRTTLSGMSQRATVEQTFVNDEDRPIEAVYTFPLSDGAAVCGFEVITGDRVLTGQVDETNKAIEKYDDAIGAGHAAYMAEQDRPDVFTVRVGNLKPKQAAMIRLTYISPLEFVDDTVRVTYPTTIAPRYVTSSGTDALTAMIDGEALNPPHVLSVPYGLTLDVDIALGRGLAGLTSPSHPIRIDPAGDEHDVTKRARVTLAAGVTAMDRAVVLEVKLAKEIKPTVQLARPVGGGKESFLAVTFVPSFDDAASAESEPSETIFVIDCSGSMQGQSIMQATAALELCLRSMSAGDTFNICKFGSTFQLMAPEPLAYSAATLDQALAYTRIQNSLGGTELLAPLQAVLPVPPSVGKFRNIILLTDGQVTNEAALLALAQRHRGRNRIFSFGIGPACSEFLVRGLARVTGGAAEFIAADERIEEKVLQTFARLTSPVATDVHLDWGNADVQTLAALPPVFDGDAMTVFAKCLGTPPATVSLSCNTSTGAHKWTADVPPAYDDGGLIATMWARRTIQSMEEVNDIRSSPSLNTPNSVERAALIELSKQFGLLCSLTSFVAVEHRSLEERTAGQPALRRVPVMLAHGWGGVRGPAGSAIIDGMPVLLPSQFGVMMEGKARSSALIRRKVDDSSLGAILFDKSSAGPAKSLPADELTVLLTSQSAAGWFDWNSAIEAIACKLVPDWHRRFGTIVTAATALGLPSADDHKHVVQTVAALQLLSGPLAARETLWRRAAAKARRYLADTTGKSTEEIEKWIEEVATTK